MELSQIHRFLEIANTGTMEYFMPNNNASYEAMLADMIALEMELGCKLFYIQENQCRLTDEGAFFLSYAMKIEGVVQECYAAFGRNTAKSRPIRLSLRACTGLMDVIYTEFQKEHPELELEITQHEDEETLCDLYITTWDEPIDDDNHITLLKEPLRLYVPDTHRFASKESVPASELRNEYFIMQKTGNPIRAIINRFFEKAGITPHISLETDSNLIYQRIVAAGAAICFVPSLTSCWATKMAGRTVAVAEAEIYRYIVLSWDGNIARSDAARTVCAFIKYFFSQVSEAEKHTGQIVVHTFGFFDVYVQGVPVYFSNKKAKELLALLIDRRGGFVSMEQAIDALWENEPCNDRLKRRYRSVVISLRETLSRNGIEDIVRFLRGGTHIVRTGFVCDLYEHLQGSSSYPFYGEYLSDYSWGENTCAILSARE